MEKVNVFDVSLNVYDEGTGRIVLFVHGFPLDHSMWSAQLDALSGEYRVIAPDLRGFGSNQPIDGTVTMERFADDLSEMLDALDVEEPVVYCGLSMGGYIGWQFVRKYAHRLCGLVLCDTRAGADTTEGVANREKMAASVLADGVGPVAKAMLPNLFSRETLDSRVEVVSRVRKMILSTAPTSIAAALYGMASRPDMTELLPSIDLPTLVIVGSEDKLTTASEMRTIATTIPQAKYFEVAAAGHMSPMEDPQAVNEAITSFLRSL